MGTEMDQHLTGFLLNILPPEIVAEIEDHLIAAYRRENARRIYEICVRHQFTPQGGLSMLYKKDPNSETQWLGVYYESCVVCGDPMEIVRQSINPFYVDGIYKVQHLQKSHARNCLVIAVRDNRGDSIDRKKIRYSIEQSDREWYY